MDEFDIYLRGFAADGAEAPEAGLERVFGLERVRGRELIRSLPRIVKRHVSGESAERYEYALREIGADFELRRSPIRPAQIIAVSGGHALDEEVSLQQHGSTLTLPLPERAGPLQAPQPRSAGGTGPRHAQTVVGSAEQLSSRVLTSVARAEDFSDEADDFVSDPISPSPATAQATWTEALPDAPVLSELPPLPVLPPLPELPPLEPPRPATTVPVPPPTSAANVPNAWAPIEPSTSAVAASTGEFPQPWEVPGLQLDGRPDWLVDGPGAHQAVELMNEPYPITDPGGLEPILSDPAPSAGGAGRAQPRSLRSPPLTPHPVGNVIGRELGYEPSWLLRLGLRVGIGVSLFIIVLAVRHLRVFDRQFDRELGHFADVPAEPLRAGNDSNDAPSATGPDAATWLESDMHQFTNGDKDRVRALVQRFNSAGAHAVRIGHITRSGVVQISGELVVELPDEADKRKAVLDEYQRFLDGTFGGLAAPAKDPGGGALHVTL